VHGQSPYFCRAATAKQKTNTMSNKKVVETYMEGFRTTNHATILSCLTEDVVWEMPGFFHHTGIEAFDKEIENPNADGHPDIAITRMVEEGNIVIAEGSVKAKLKDGNTIDAVFCDVFHFRNHKISKLTTYLMFNK
jgi:ketosteroid isomerase-like protein